MYERKFEIDCSTCKKTSEYVTQSIFPIPDSALSIYCRHCGSYYVDAYEEESDNE